MANLLLNDVVKVTFFNKQGSQVSQNVVHFIVDAVTGTPTEQGVADDLSTVWSSLYADLMTDKAEYRGLRLQRVGLMPTQGVLTTSGVGAGTLAGDALPPQTAGLIRKLTDTVGRTGRGRFYIPFPAEASSDANGRPNVSYQTSMAAFVTKLTTTTTYGPFGNNADLTPCLFKITLGIGTVKRITSAVRRADWATQRRRGFLNRGDVSPV